MRFAGAGLLALLAVAGLPVQAETAGSLARPTADRIFVDKSDRVMTLYRNGAALRRYKVSLGQGGLAPKQREGDLLVPEGTYKIDWRNPDSAFHLSLRISYPTPEQTAAANARGENAGFDIMIHSLPNGWGWVGGLQRWFDWTAGCIAVTNAEMEEIWEMVPVGTDIQIRH